MQLQPLERQKHQEYERDEITLRRLLWDCIAGGIVYTAAQQQQVQTQIVCVYSRFLSKRGADHALASGMSERDVRWIGKCKNKDVFEWHYDEQSREELEVRDDWIITEILVEGLATVNSSPQGATSPHHSQSAQSGSMGFIVVSQFYKEWRE